MGVALVWAIAAACLVALGFALLRWWRAADLTATPWGTRRAAWPAVARRASGHHRLLVLAGVAIAGGVLALVDLVRRVVGAPMAWVLVVAPVAGLLVLGLCKVLDAEGNAAGAARAGERARGLAAHDALLARPPALQWEPDPEAWARLENHDPRTDTA